MRFARAEPSFNAKAQRTQRAQKRNPVLLRAVEKRGRLAARSTRERPPFLRVTPLYSPRLSSGRSIAKPLCVFQRPVRLLDTAGHGLSLEAELRGAESVLLRHRGFRAVQAVEDELAEKWEANEAVAADVMLAFVID